MPDYQSHSRKTQPELPAAHPLWPYPERLSPIRDSKVVDRNLGPVHFSRKG